MSKPATGANVADELAGALANLERLRGSAPALATGILKVELEDEDGQRLPVFRVHVARPCLSESPGGYICRIGSSRREMAPDIYPGCSRSVARAGSSGFHESVVPATTRSNLHYSLTRPFLAGDVVDDSSPSAGEASSTASEDEMLRKTSRHRVGRRAPVRRKWGLSYAGRGGRITVGVGCPLRCKRMRRVDQLGHADGSHERRNDPALLDLRKISAGHGEAAGENGDQAARRGTSQKPRSS